MCVCVCVCVCVCAQWLVQAAQSAQGRRAVAPSLSRAAILAGHRRAVLQGHSTAALQRGQPHPRMALGTASVANGRGGDGGMPWGTVSAGGEDAVHDVAAGVLCLGSTEGAVTPTAAPPARATWRERMRTYWWNSRGRIYIESLKTDRRVVFEDAATRRPRVRFGRCVAVCTGHRT